MFCSNPSGVRRTKVLILQNTFKFYLLLLLTFQIILFARLISSKSHWILMSSATQLQTIYWSQNIFKRAIYTENFTSIKLTNFYKKKKIKKKINKIISSHFDPPITLYVYIQLTTLITTPITLHFFFFFFSLCPYK